MGEQNKKQEMRQNGKKTEVSGLRHFWGEYYVYIVSSLLIVVAMIVILVIKKCWPFGNSLLIGGDFMLQGWPFLVELKHKLMEGDSLLYTWNAGFGTNFYSIIAYGLVNPITLLYLLFPVPVMPMLNILIYGLSIISCNCTMLYFLTHRPGHSLPRNRIANMLFSMSYSLCMYMISNTNNWTFLICAVLFPLIILGLENFVANKGWKLYFITLALSFLFNYYFTGLFCIFIILYYLTLEFGSWSCFFKKSLKILGISIVAILLSAVFLIPIASQMMGQEYTVSTVVEGIWFTSFFDIIKNVFAFNYIIDRGAAGDSYGEVNLYYGLLPLLLTTFYFLNPKIKRSVRLKKLLLVAFYLVAFNLNSLNYLMHLMHYPAWFPNRFALFFTLLCIILAYEGWVAMEQTEFRYATVIRGMGIGLGWVILALLSLAFAETIQYTFTYTYSVILLLAYMVAVLFLPYLKGKEARILAVVGCIELCLNFMFLHLIRIGGSYGYVKRSEDVKGLEKFLAEAPIHSQEEFCRTLEGKNTVLSYNGGLLYNFKAASLFSSSIGNHTYFLWAMGVAVGGNNIKSYTYTMPTMSLLNIRYIYQDDTVEAQVQMPEELFTSASNMMEGYKLLDRQGDFSLYENPTVLSVGYMVDKDAGILDTDVFLGSSGIKEGVFAEATNAWIEGICKVPGVMEEVEPQVTGIDVLNGEAVMMENFFLLSDGRKHIESEDIKVAGHLEPKEEWLLEAAATTAYDRTEDTVIRFDCEAVEGGDYYVEINGSFASAGYLEPGETVHIFYSMDSQYLEASGMAGSYIHLYRINEAQWQKAYDILSRHQLQVEHYTSTSMDGTIQVEDKGLMFTSIPYDDNWHLYVDGEEKETIPLWDGSFLAAELEPGVHTIHLEYRQKGLLLGGCISVIALGITVLVFITGRRRDFLLESEMDEAGLETYYEETVLEHRKRKRKKTEEPEGEPSAQESEE